MTGDHSNPFFPAKHLAKDIDLFTDEAQSMNMETAALEGIRRLVSMAVDKGYAEEDYSALFDIINPGKQ